MDLEIEFEQEDDGRWIAEIPSLPGVMVYGASKHEAHSKVQALALRVIADQIERNLTATDHVHFAAKARRVFRALLKIGWQQDSRSTSGSHRTLLRAGFPAFTWSFHDRDELGPKMLARIAKRTGLRPEDISPNRPLQ